MMRRVLCFALLTFLFRFLAVSSCREYSVDTCAAAALVAYRSTVAGACYSSSAFPFSEVDVFEITVCTATDSTVSYFMDESCAPESADGDSGGVALLDCDLRSGTGVYDTTLCSFSPTSQPSAQPSIQPSAQPSSQPSGQPSAQPSSQPSGQPSSQPSEIPLAGSTGGFLLERFYSSGGSCAEADMYQENGE